jgi:guanylate kinase
MAPASGLIFIIAAPSGAGKSTLVAALLAAERNLRLSISYTTRPPRSGEADGTDYNFVTSETFRRMAAAGEFLETAEVYGNYYATSRRWLCDTLASGQDVVLEIDWQGARQVRRGFAEAIGIFILPPSIEVLRSRLQSRAQDSPATILQRVACAREEIGHVHEFDYVIINNDFPEAVKDLTGIVRAERSRLARQAARYHDLIEQLIG